jgi:glycosyltransferase involved in cell wall biosynthesis
MVGAAAADEARGMKALVIGSMNCMPTEYAILLTKYCEEVVHYYDADENDTLSNPTIRWGDKSGERTKGISLRKISIRHHLSYLLPRLLHYELVSQLIRADLVILSGPAISLARLVKGSRKRIVALSYGSDISLYCNPAWPEMAVENVRGIKAVFKSQLKFLQSQFVKFQTAGLRGCTHYSYFIAGMDPEIDSLLDRLLAGAKRPIRLPRYSISLSVLDGHKRADQLLHLKDAFKILFPVRFSDNELLGNKGWRLLLDGLRKYRALSGRPFACVCFRKGDYAAAQAYAKEIGVDDVIEWHDVVPFDTLERYFVSADVVIEQLGSHWISQGLFAMALGKPVIGRLATEQQIEFFAGSGLLAVHDVDSLAGQLVNCEAEAFREEAGRRSRAFVPAKAAIEPEFLKWGIL